MRLSTILVVALGTFLLPGAQIGRRPPHESEKDEVRLPDGKSQKTEILKADHKKSQEDAAEVVRLSQELKEELDKGPYNVVDMRLLKKAEDIERLARNIKNRMKRN